MQIHQLFKGRFVRFKGRFLRADLLDLRADSLNLHFKLTKVLSIKVLNNKRRCLLLIGFECMTLINLGVLGQDSWPRFQIGKSWD